jgi:hypothetical protein
MRFPCFAVSALLVLFAVGCGDSDDEGAAFDVLPCEAAQFRLTGAIDAQAVDITEVAAGGFVQGNAATFDQNSLFGGSNPDPTTTKVHLEWSGALAHGDSTHVSGTVVMPAGQPRGEEVLCVGGDSRVGFSDDGHFGFSLSNLSGGSNCSVSVPGTLQGCWRSRAR